MKKMIDTTFVYMILGLVAGVFYREFTKFMGFEGLTTLRAMHPHLLALGMGIFLILALFVRVLPALPSEKTFHWFYILYNAGLVVTVGLFAVRGIFQVNGTLLSAGASAAISGIAGIGHMLLGIGLFCLFIALKKAAGKAEA